MMDPDALDTLRSRAHETMAALAGEVCEEAGIAVMMHNADSGYDRYATGAGAATIAAASAAAQA
jgi:hypothetical protein